MHYPLNVIFSVTLLNLKNSITCKMQGGKKYEKNYTSSLAYRTLTQ